MLMEIICSQKFESMLDKGHQGRFRFFPPSSKEDYKIK